MAPSRVVLDGLDQVVSKVMLFLAPRGRQVVVAPLSPKDTGANVEVVFIAKFEDDWALVNKRAVEAMKSTADVLHLFDSHLLQLLEGHSTDTGVLERVEKMAARLRAQALVAGRSFLNAILKGLFEIELPL